MAAETTVQIECPCGWRLRISEMAAYEAGRLAGRLVAAHRCELVEPELEDDPQEGGEG